MDRNWPQAPRHAQAQPYCRPPHLYEQADSVGQRGPHTTQQHPGMQGQGGSPSSYYSAANQSPAPGTTATSRPLGSPTPFKDVTQQDLQNDQYLREGRQRIIEALRQRQCAAEVNPQDVPDIEILDLKYSTQLVAGTNYFFKWTMEQYCYRSGKNSCIKRVNCQATYYVREWENFAELQGPYCSNDIQEQGGSPSSYYSAASHSPAPGTTAASRPIGSPTPFKDVTQQDLQNDHYLREGRQRIIEALRQRQCAAEANPLDVPDIEILDLKYSTQPVAGTNYFFKWTMEQYCYRSGKNSCIKRVNCQATYYVREWENFAELQGPYCSNDNQQGQGGSPSSYYSAENQSPAPGTTAASRPIGSPTPFKDVTQQDLQNDQYLREGRERIIEALRQRQCAAEPNPQDVPDVQILDLKYSTQPVAGTNYFFKWTTEQYCYRSGKNSCIKRVNCQATYYVREWENFAELQGPYCSNDNQQEQGGSPSSYYSAENQSPAPGTCIDTTATSRPIGSPTPFKDVTQQDLQNDQYLREGRQRIIEALRQRQCAAEANPLDVPDIQILDLKYSTQLVAGTNYFFKWTMEQYCYRSGKNSCIKRVNCQATYYVIEWENFAELQGPYCSDSPMTT